ncbi:histidine kinase dimerization/phosphoacceptor domain-containing protein [Streptomyces sp. NPDC006687]|uniref:histidine kinase dimerization/phosphoacceptor domain-containing protein n=1 Tax=unclassified Streptomyces TaxID=2593676 RepID=UPI0033D12C8E
MAGETHDLLDHRLSLVALHPGGLEMAGEGSHPEMHRTAVLVHSSAREAMRELRGALGVLRAGRPTAGKSEPPTGVTGTRADVDALAADSRAAGVAVRPDWAGDDPAAPSGPPAPSGARPDGRPRASDHCSARQAPGASLRSRRDADRRSACQRDPRGIRTPRIKRSRRHGR